jgi:tRNA modification GTPase
MTAPPPPARVSVLTPPAAGAIGVLRVEGSNAVPLVDSFLEPHSGKRLANLAAGQLLYARFVIDGETLDDVLVVRDTNDPLSPSSGAIVDIYAHGGTFLLDRMVGRAHARCPGPNLRRGCPGALGRAEPPSKLRPSTPWSKPARRRRSSLPRPPTPASARRTRSPDCQTGGRQRSRILIAGYATARALLTGLTVALIGPPNTGKSTLLNAFAGRQAALTSPEAGTTRDWVTADLNWAGVPVTLIDTAGLRETADSLEARAIASGATHRDRADARILVLDASEPLPNLEDLLPAASAGPLIVAANKSDLTARWSPADLGRQLGVPCCSISARMGEGLPELRAALIDQAIGGAPSPRRTACFTPRQREALRLALDSLPGNPTRAIAQLRAIVAPLEPATT